MYIKALLHLHLKYLCFGFLLSFVYYILQFSFDFYKSTDDMINNSIEVAKKRFNLKTGDLVVVTGGFTGETYQEHTTNLMKIVNIK
jgi:pyruvate kinase